MLYYGDVLAKQNSYWNIWEKEDVFKDSVFYLVLFRFYWKIALARRFFQYSFSFGHFESSIFTSRGRCRVVIDSSVELIGMNTRRRYVQVFVQ